MSESFESSSPNWLKRTLQILLLFACFLMVWFIAYSVYVLTSPQFGYGLMSFRVFMQQWGAVMSVVITIVVAVLAALIPSRVDAKIDRIAELLQHPLTDFAQVYEKAFELLQWLGTQPGSVFQMISATPVFGIELSEDNRLRWANTLKQRIVTQHDNQPITTLLCLDGETNGSPIHSPLWDFCQELDHCGELEKSEVQSSHELYYRSVEAFSEFAKLRDYKGFSLECGPRPPLQTILATNPAGHSKGIIYFTTIASETRGLVVSGFMTEDERWLNLIREVFAYVKAQSHDILDRFVGDARNEEQRTRCRELLLYQLQHSEPYQVDVNGFKIQVFPGVFPPQIGIGTSLLLQAINHIGMLLKETFPSRSFVGFDIGTGTGILALGLSIHCDRVYATDILKEAIKNAEENIKNVVTKHQLRGEIKVCEGNLFDPLPAWDRDAVPLIVFNYPFYPSPLAIFNPRGRQTAGLPVLHEFFGEVKKVVGTDGVIVMPYSSIAAEHDPKTAAKRLGFLTTEMFLTRSAERRDLIYIFTYNKEVFKRLQKGAQS